MQKHLLRQSYIARKIKCALKYSNLHQVLSNLLWVLTYFITRVPYVDTFRYTFILDHILDVADFDFESF
jgi:hypothetical protein